MSRRILVDLTPASGAHGVRGIGSYVRGLSAALAAAPHATRETTVLLMDGEQDAPPGYRAIRPSPINRWRPQDLSWVIRWLTDAAALRRTGARAFHMTDPRAPMRPALARRLAVTAYDLIPLEDKERAGIRPHRRAIFRLYLESLRSADRVIAISSTTAAVVTGALDIDPGRVDVVYPVVESPGTPWGREPQLEPTFLLIGVPDSHKRPELAVAALAEFRRRHRAGRLRVIGPVARLHVERVRGLARAAGVGDSVAIEGSIAPDALEEAFRSATALLALSRVEGFGLPPVEAVLRGVPVIAADTPVARETLLSAARFVAPEPRLIAEAMERPVAPDVDAQTQLARRYSAESAATSLWRSYERLIGD